MSNLFGGGGAKTAATTPTQAMGIDFTSSQYGPPLSVVYGTNKVAGNCIWYGDFKATAQMTKTGGKGGGGSTVSGYTYSASFQLALCEGPIQGIGTVFNGTSTVSLSSVGAVTALGTQGQPAWSHLSGAEALGYTETALVSVQNLSLGSSASLPDWNFEVQGLQVYGGGIVDADPAAILLDICTNAEHGISFPWLGDVTQYHDYCVANGLFLSPVYDQEQSGENTLDDLFKYTNSAAWFSEGVLKVAPYGDVAVTGNGVTYTPNVTPLFDLGTADFIVENPGDAPVQVTRKSAATCMNMVRVQFTDRANTYHTGVTVATIDEDIITNGQRADDTEDVTMCTTAPVARFIAQNLVQRAFFIRNTYEFKLGWRYCMLEPMDIVTLTDAASGLNLTPVRITEVAEDENGTLSITAEEFPEGVGHAAIYNTQPNSGGSIDPNADPGAVNPPYFFRMPGFLASNNTPEIGIAVCGANALWAAADIYVSHDGSSYNYLGTTAQPATYGDLASALPAGSADPDTTNTPTVQLYVPGELLGGAQIDADNFVTLAMVDQEVISYETSTLTGTETYQLSYLRRGAYGTANAAHSTGAPFVRLDDAVYRMPVEPSLIGTTIYVKFLSINAFGRTPRTLADETAYTYVIGSNVELPDVPPVPASFATTGVGGAVSITWNNTNPSAVGCTSIERSTASTGPWTVIAQVGPTSTSYTDHFPTGATYYYRARARGPLVASGWSAYTSVFNSTGIDETAIVGDNVCPNPGFELNAAGLSLGTSVTSGLVCDGWVVGENSSGSGTCTIITDGNAARTHGGSNRLQLQLPSGISIPNGGNLFVGAWTAKKIAVTAGDVFYLSAYIFNDRGTTPPAGITTQTRVFLRYYDANDNYLSQSGIIDSSSGGTMATPLTGTSTVPSTASYARIYCQLLFANSSGSAVSSVNGWFISNIDDIIVNKQVALEVAGSARQIGDQRNLPAITFSNYGSGWNGMSLSYTSTTTSATVTASAATLQAGSVAINYNAASTTVTGSAGTSKTYYLYYTDATHSGGSQTLHASTSIITALNNDGNVYIASMSVTFPSSGTGGGSGGGGCPLRTAWVIRRGRHGGPQHVRAGKVRVGDWLLRSDGEWAEVTFSRPELQPCVRIVADGFGTLGCSISAPMQTRNGAVLARDCLDHELVAQGRHAVVTDLRGIGDQWVQHITLANAPDDFYLVGDAKDALFAHHNMKPP